MKIHVFLGKTAGRPGNHILKDSLIYFDLLVRSTTSIRKYFATLYFYLYFLSIGYRHNPFKHIKMLISQPHSHHRPFNGTCHLVYVESVDTLAYWCIENQGVLKIIKLINFREPCECGDELPAYFESMFFIEN